MYLLILGGMIWGIIALIKSAHRRKAERRKAEQMAKAQAEIARIKANAKAETARMVAIEREQMRQAKEQERQAAMLAKHEEQIAKLEFRMKQAEADILTERARLDHYTAKLSALDEELAKIDSDIEFYQRANKVDDEKKALVVRAKVEDKIFNFEEKVRACEKRMAKAENTIAEAERKMKA